MSWFSWLFVIFVRVLVVKVMLNFCGLRLNLFCSMNDDIDRYVKNVILFLVVVYSMVMKSWLWMIVLVCVF